MYDPQNHGCPDHISNESSSSGAPAELLCPQTGLFLTEHISDDVGLEDTLTAF